MSWADFATVSPIVAAVVVAGAILVVDLIRPGARTPAVVTALLGLAIVAAVTHIAIFASAGW